MSDILFVALRKGYFKSTTSRHNVKQGNLTLSINYLSYLSSLDGKRQMSFSLSQSMYDFRCILRRSFTQVEIVDLKNIKELLILVGHQSYNFGATSFESREILSNIGFIALSCARHARDNGFTAVLVIKRLSILAI